MKSKHLPREKFLPLFVLAILIAVVFLAPPTVRGEPNPGRKLNVLFIAVDDLRPELGCYGRTYVKSPNIDRLAERGTVFLRAYCQQAICGPTRASLLSGLRPDTTRVWGNRESFRKAVPDAVTLPQHFKNHGYHTQGMGKIFHGSFPEGAGKYYYKGARRRTHDPQSWSVPMWLGGPRYYYTPEGIAAARKDFQRISGKSSAALDEWVDYFCRGPASEAPEVPDNVPYDGQVADRAIETLGQIKDRPFFLAVGFIKPHLPFVAPKKYWDLYDPDEIDPADNPFAPKDVPSLAMHNFGELRYYSDIPGKGPINDQMARRLVHGYRACVSYVDAQIGRVLAELDRLKLRDRTIVVLWGDHGWHLGDHGLWCKHSNFENATRVPLIVSAPDAKAPGRKTERLVELVDIYPTLSELAGLPRQKRLEGTSFAPLLDDPQEPWKPAAFSQYPRGQAMGYSMRTDRYRFTLWQDRRNAKRILGIELYDHVEDPDENVNLAKRPENAELVNRLTKQVRAGWRACASQ